MTRTIQPSAIVLDGSVALSWCFADESDPYADLVLRALPKMPAVVPTLWHLEIANALLMGERRKRSQEADTAQWLLFLRSLPIIAEEDTTARAWSDVLHLARSHDLSAYDAAYLELALRRGFPLATLDKKLRKAAKKAGVGLYVL